LIAFLINLLFALILTFLLSTSPPHQSDFDRLKGWPPEITA
jgi:hypothetical protein